MRFIFSGLGQTWTLKFMKAGNDNGWPHNIQLKAEMLTKTQVL